MKVYKFGGASVRNADGVRNLRKIIDDEQNLFIIVSAMGKTTNALERVFGAVQRHDPQAAGDEIASLREYHAAIIDELWHGPKRLEAVERLFGELERVAAGEGLRSPRCGVVVRYDRGLRRAWSRRRSSPNTSITPGWRTAGSTCAAACAPSSGTRTPASIWRRPEALLKGALEGVCGADFSSGRGLHRRRARRYDDDARPRRLGLLGRRGGQSARRRVDVGVEGCGRRAERRPEDLPRRRADRRTELPRYDRTGLQRRADHTPEDDQAAAKQEHSALCAAFRRQAQAGYGHPRHVGAGGRADPDSQERPSAADDPFARLLVRARGEVRHDLLAARAFSREDQSDPQFGGQSEPLRR